MIGEWVDRFKRLSGASDTLLVNTLCVGIGACAGVDAIYIVRYWHVVNGLFWEVVGCLRLL